jgi:hypothetical protein
MSDVVDENENGPGKETRPVIESSNHASQDDAHDDRGRGEGRHLRANRAQSANALKVLYTWTASEQTNGGETRAKPWPEFAQWLATHKVGPKEGEAISCAVFDEPKEGEAISRSADNVSERWTVGLDIETNKKTGEVPPSLQEVERRLKDLNLAGVIWTTYNHTPDAPRYRVMLLNKPFLEFGEEPEKRAHRHDIDTYISRIVADMLGLGGVIDASKCGAESLFFTARHPEGSEYYSAVIEGAPLDTAALIKKANAHWKKDEAVRQEAFERAEENRRKWLENGGLDFIGMYNERFPLEDQLIKYKYVQNERRPKDWRSPYQTSGSYATQVRDNKWVSLSGTDAEKEIGAPSKKGARYGDAFDLYAHFEHGGDYKAAGRAVVKLLKLEVEGPPPGEASDFSHLLDATEAGDEGEGQASTVDPKIDALPIAPAMKRKILTRKINKNYRPGAISSVLLAMVGQGCSDQQIKDVFLDTQYWMAGHLAEQKEGYLDQQIEKTRKQVKALNASPMAKLNEHFFYVPIGGTSVIAEETTDHKGRPTLIMHKPSNFKIHQGVGNEFIESLDPNTGKLKQVSKADYWLRHRERRAYKGLVFEPNGEAKGYYNLWTGFAVKPKPGDCSKLLAHIRDNCAQGNEDHFNWIVGFFAQMVQQPDKKLGTALVFRGKEGVGKSKVAEIMQSLLGAHYVMADDERFVTGRFNSHIARCILLHSEEATWAGDKAAESKIKSLITSKTMLLEYKGLEPIEVGNYVRMFFTANADWVVPVSGEGRRFAVFDISEAHMQDKPYFAAIDEEMDKGGREAFLDFLLKFDLSKVNLREVPKTDALRDQKQLSFNIETNFLYHKLKDGELPWATTDADGNELPNVCPRDMFMNDYLAFAAKLASKAMRASPDRMGKVMRKIIPELAKDEKLTYQRGWDEERKRPRLARDRVYRFPDLATCRRRFDEYMKQEQEWDDQADWEFKWRDEEPPM